MRHQLLFEAEKLRTAAPAHLVEPVHLTFALGNRGVIHDFTNGRYIGLCATALCRLRLRFLGTRQVLNYATETINTLSHLTVVGWSVETHQGCLSFNVVTLNYVCSVRMGRRVTCSHVRR